MTLLKRFLIGLTFATLVFLPAWNELFPGSVARYFGELQGIPLAVAGLLLNSAILSLGLMTLWPWLKGGGFLRKVMRMLLFLAAASIAALAFRSLLAQQIYAINGDAWRRLLPMGLLRGIVVAAILGVSALVWRYEDLMLKLGRKVLVLLVPLPLLLAGRILWAPKAPVPLPSPRSAHAPRRTRAVFIIFDEMDYGWTFEHRPEGLLLPQLDRLAKESCFFTQAFPPASETHRSIPALMTGNLVASAKTASEREFLLQLPGKGWVRWSEAEDLTRKASRLGQSSFFLDFYHSYNQKYRDLRPELEISRFPEGRWHAAKGWHRSLSAAIAHQWRCVVETLPGGTTLGEEPDDMAVRARVHQEMVRVSREALQSRAFDLVILHWPIPHAPTIWDASTGELLNSARPLASNLDNLALADRTLAELRDAMEASGQWDESLVIVTSDHWQRCDFGQALPLRPPGEYRRVPLLVKLPGQRDGRRLDQRISNLVAHDLVAQALKGSLRELEDVDLASREADWEGIYNPWIK